MLFVCDSVEAGGGVSQFDWIMLLVSSQSKLYVQSALMEECYEEVITEGVIYT